MNASIKKMNLRPATQQGFTLVELMIAMLIGLIVVAAAGGVFLSNSQVYRSTESVGRIQENARSAFEIMSRDVREAGAIACNGADHLEGEPALLLSALKRGISATGAVLDIYAGNQYMTAVSDHIKAAASITLAAGNSEYSVNDTLLVCNADISVLFNVQSVSGADLTPAQPLKNRYGANLCFWRPATGAIWNSDCGMKGESLAYVAKPVRYRWEVRDNGRGGMSLYRQTAKFASGGFVNMGGAAEVAENVTQMTLAFRRAGDAAFQTAYAGWGDDDWKEVIAVQVRLVLQGSDNAQGTDGNVLSREVSTTITLRNRKGVL